jgi:hypothetical protein
MACYGPTADVGNKWQLPELRKSPLVSRCPGGKDGLSAGGGWGHPLTSALPDPAPRLLVLL